MIDKITTPEGLRRFLPRLTDLLENQGLLLVLDNLETLLTGQAQWRDPPWADLITALTGPAGASRAVPTSRNPPAGPDPRMQGEPAHAPARDAAALPPQELPTLRPPG